MATRFGWLVGLASLLLVILRLDRVLDNGAGSPNWLLVAVAAGLIGALITWICHSYRLGTVSTMVAHLVGIALLVARVTAPSTLVAGFVPAASTPGAVGKEMAVAIDILRFGAPPVLAVPGLVALVGVGMWLLASAWTSGVLVDRPWLGILPPLGFYLYLAVMDRAQTEPAWLIAFALLAASGLLATSRTVRSRSGRARDAYDRPVPRRRFGTSAAVVGIVVVAGLAGSTAVSWAVPGTGAIRWRNPSTGTGTEGGIAYNPFVGLHQDLTSQSETPVFVAQLEGAPTANRQMYWLLQTFDRYDGSVWVRGNEDFHTPSQTWEDPDQSYRGATTTVTQTIRIVSLRDDQLPVLYSPVAVASNDDVVTSGAEAGADGSLRVNAISFSGLSYRVRSEVPTLDVAALATEGGQLSPLFAQAAQEGLYTGGSESVESPPTPAVIAHYLQLPELDPSIEELAKQVTAGAGTPFERALLLEDFLRGFTYDLNVSSGSGSLELAVWLNDPQSPNYRRGYCEQFATAMGVMGRLVGLPTRVVMGFTPGKPAQTTEGPALVVMQKNAHAWVEVWFDQMGWVRFDPTPLGDGSNSPTSAAIGFDPGAVDLSQQANNAGAGTDVSPPLVGDIPNIPMQNLAGTPSSAGSGSGSGWIWAVLVALAVISAVAIPTAKGVRRRTRMHRARQGDITAVWEEITDRLSDLGSPPPPHETPLEFAAATDADLVPLARAYSASIYGGIGVDGAADYLRTAERWLHARYTGPTRAKAAFSPRSLSRR